MDGHAGLVYSVFKACYFLQIREKITEKISRRYDN
jgi:hypothetical protein